MIEKRMKRGQVTIFIIVAILIVGLVALIFFIIPKTKTETGFDVQNPRAFIQNCMEDTVAEVVDIISSKGGSVVPEFYFMYNGERVEYLCYTNEYYKTCVVQQPMLKQHIESEIKTAIEGDVETCFTNLEESYRIEGYTAELQRGATEVELLPKRVVVNFAGYVLAVTKALISIANSIIDGEATYGEAETTAYMTYYKDLKVEKHTQQDGTKVYIISDRDTGSKFQFASRSVAWPPGFAS